MFPHERSLVKKYKGRPFVILGVNRGEDGGDVASMEKKYEVSWRSFSSREDQGIPDIADTLELDAAGYAMLIDAKADLLVWGMGERQVLDIAVVTAAEAVVLIVEQGAQAAMQQINAR